MQIAHDGETLFEQRARGGRVTEFVEHLLGHTSIKTTEIYIKARLPDLVAPTSRPMVKLKAGDGK